MGTPCGGTTYLSGRLCAAGLDVKHERIGLDGMVCGLWTLPYEFRATRDKGRPQLGHYQWEQLAIAVRHPLSMAETAPKVIEHLHYEQTWFTNRPRINALRYWVLAHEAAAAQIENPMIIRMDSHFKKDYALLASILRVKNIDPGIGYMNTKSRRWERLSWGAWFAYDPAFAVRGRILVQRYALDN